MKLEKRWVRLEQLCFAGLIIFGLLAELIELVLSRAIPGLGTVWRRETVYPFYTTFSILGCLCLIGGFWIALNRLCCPNCGRAHVVLLEKGEVQCRRCGVWLKIE